MWLSSNLNDSPLVPVHSSTFNQGSEWSSSEKYLKAKSFFTKEPITSARPMDYLTQTNVGFDNRDDDQIPVGADYYSPIVTPSDEFFLDVSDGRSQEYMDLLKARGEDIHNNVWLPVTKPLQHVLSFQTVNADQPNVRIKICRKKWG